MNLYHNLNKVRFPTLISKSPSCNFELILLAASQIAKCKLLIQTLKVTEELDW